jgi:proton-dependent oligopeptide transporter, POT family
VAGAGPGGWDLPTLARFGIAMLLLGASFVVMALAAVSILHSHIKAGPAWLFATYVMQTVGELFLSPIGLSRVSRLSPKRYASQMMGTWFLAAAIGGLIAGVLGGDVGASTVSAMPPLFLGMAGTGLLTGVLMLAVTWPLRWWES